MGIIIGKLRRKKSTYDVLEKLENEIISIEEFQRSTAQAQKKIVFRFVILAVLVYFLLALFLYIYFSQISVNHKLLCLVPLVAFPLIVWIIKRFLTWYYNRKIRKNEKKLITLKEEKKKILDNVMETETYKVAKKILDKFGNEKKKSPTAETPLVIKKNEASTALVPSARLNETGLRQRQIPSSNLRNRLSFGGVETPARRLPTSQSLDVVPSTGPRPGTPLKTPREILPRDRSIFDKMAEYLVGDGPSNRYALICNKCNSHNGMALKEEFEYLSFRCCYCFSFNPARKKRPQGPATPSLPSTTKKADVSDSSLSDSESEPSKPVITELPRSESPDTGKNSDFDKLSDLDVKNSDNDSSPMEVDSPANSEKTTDEPSSQEKTVD